MKRIANWKGLALADRGCAMGIVILDDGPVEISEEMDETRCLELFDSGFKAKAFITRAVLFPPTSIPNTSGQSIEVDDRVLIGNGQGRYVLINPESARS